MFEENEGKPLELGISYYVSCQKSYRDRFITIHIDIICLLLCTNLPTSKGLYFQGENRIVIISSSTKRRPYLPFETRHRLDR